MQQPLINTVLVMRRRHLALVIIRVVAATLVVYGGIHMLWGLGSSFGLSGFSLSGSFQQALTIFWSDNWNPFWYGLAIVVFAIPLALGSRRLSRWLVPLPRHECPQCGYALRELTTTRCPECGIAIARESATAESNRRDD